MFVPRRIFATLSVHVTKDEVIINRWGFEKDNFIGPVEVRKVVQEDSCGVCCAVFQ